MKLLGVLILVMTASAAWGADANYYDCKGEGVSVRMATAGYTGLPTLTVTSVGANSENSPGGSLAHVTVEETAMGLLAVGQYTQIADATLRYSLIVPRVIVGDSGLKGINGMLVRTLAGGMPPPPGAPIYPHAVQSNIFTPVSCDVRFAAF